MLGNKAVQKFAYKALGLRAVETVGDLPVAVGDYGWKPLDLVPPGDAVALTTAIKAWVDDRARLAAAGPKARAHVEKNHKIEGEAERLVAIYREMLS